MDYRLKNFNKFQSIFERLLAREKFDLINEDASFLFEVIAGNLLGNLPNRKGHYFDGATGVTAQLRKPRQIVFSGAMWVGNHKTQWLESLDAIVTDKRITKQSIHLKISIGGDVAEGDLRTAFNLDDN